MNSEVKIMKFPLVNAAGESLADIALEHFWADVFALKIILWWSPGTHGIICLLTPL